MYVKVLPKEQLSSKERSGVTLNRLIGNLYAKCAVLWLNAKLRQDSSFERLFLRLNPPPPGLFLYPPQPGGSDPTPPDISKTDGRRETDEAAFERSRRDASKTTFENLKLRSRVRSRSGQRSKSSVFRLQTVVTSNVAFFAQNFPYVLPSTRRRYWLVKLLHI